jgi:hypothetical protein
MSKVASIEKGWHLKEREPASRTSRLVVINPAALDVLEGAPKLMSPAQAGEIIGFSAYSIAEWCRTKAIEAYKVRGEWRISKSALGRFLLKGKV